MNDEHAPQAIGPFQVTRTIAQGGMATVYQAIQPSLDRPVAIKVLNLKLARNSELIARFERESTTIAKLSHPNIIQVIDRGEEHGHYYIVMEYVDGHGLDDRIRSGRIPVYQAVGIAIQVARAIEHAHSRGVIHRDIKPANVLIAGDTGTVKVTDFGIAHLAEQRISDHTLTQAQISMGTVEYMSPEQRRDARRVDARSDIFSFGVLLYEMLAGRPPVGRFRELHEVRDDTPPQLSRIVVRCLHEDPAERYPSFTELLADLQKLAEKEIVYREALAKAAHSVMKVPRKAKTAISRRTTRLFGLHGPRRRLLLYALGGMAVVLLVVLLILVPGRRLAPSASRVARLPEAASSHERSAGAAEEQEAASPGDEQDAGEVRAERLDYGEALEEADQQMAAGRYDAALTLLRQLRGQAQQDNHGREAAEAQWRIANIHEMREDVSAAATAYAFYADTFTGEGKTHMPEVLFKAGLNKARDWDPAAALGYFRRLRQEFGSHELAPEALFHEARLMEEEIDPPSGGDEAHWRQVATLYRKLLEEFPQNPQREEAYWHLAQLYVHKSEIRSHRQAIAVLEAMAAEFPKSKREPLFTAAEIARIDLDDRELARRLYEAFIRTQPESPGVRDARWRLERL